MKYSLNEVVEMAVQIERNGYAFYHAAGKRNDLGTKALELLAILSEQELNHEKIFLNLRDDEDMTQLEGSTDWELVGQYLKTIVDSRIFNSPDAAIRLATEAAGVNQIVDYAIAFEKDTLLYFHSISDAIQNQKGKDTVRKIINEEIKHVMFLTEYKKSL